MSTIGCYIIGENIIHLSTADISSSTYTATEDYIFSFKEACKKLETKLECLVIVDSLRKNELSDVHEIYKLAKEYANFVYIITPIVALLQNVLSSIVEENELKSNTVIIFIASSFGVISCILEKRDTVFHVDYITCGFDLKHKYTIQELQAFSTFCLFDSSVNLQVLDNLYATYPNILKKSFTDLLEALSFGGLQKALCIVEPGKHFEVINFTPGIIIGEKYVLEAYKTFPVTVHYSSPTFNLHNIRYPRTIRTSINMCHNIKIFKLSEKILYFSTDNSPMNYIIKYNEFGLLTIEKSDASPISPLNCNFIFTENFLIWSTQTQQLAFYDFSRNMVQISKISDKLENVKSSKDFAQIEKHISSLSGSYKSLTILFDGKIEYKIEQPNIFIIPSYIALLEHCIRSVQPNKSKLIVIVTTKTENKFYVLLKAKSGAYYVKYIGPITKTIIGNDIFSEFLKANTNKKLNIFRQTTKYRKTILESVKNGIFDKIIFETEHLMTVDFNEDYCRIVWGGDESYLAISGDELIPTYISFSQESLLIGKAAKADLENCQEAVLYDFVKCLGINLSQSSDLKLDLEIKDKLAEMDNSDDPKLGFKIKTIKGFQIISPEMALTIFLKKLVGIYENFTKQEITKIELRRFGNKLSSAQINALKFAESKLKKEVIYLEK
uniref:Uncharacterized protein n=1 Tax=Panagrolaimus sp. ES5 TaxID=591445 RepID=A0AC34GNN0_9BILA